MRKKHFIYLFIIIALVSSLIVIQIKWLSYSSEISLDNFTIKANKALENTNREFEETIYCVDYVGELDLESLSELYVLSKQANTNAVDTVSLYTSLNDVTSDSISFKKVSHSLPSKVKVEIKSQFQIDTMVVPEGKEYIDNNIGYYFLENGFNTSLYDSILTKNLVLNGINENYLFCVQSKDSIVYISDESLYKELETSQINSHFDIKGTYSKSFKVYLFFPGVKSASIRKQAFIVLGSLFIFSVLIIVLIFFFRVLFIERKYLHLKTSFIGNISHEFQTPVSNINLALDSIQSVDKNLLTIKNIIKEENNRIKDNINKVLQISTFKHENIVIEKEPVNLFELIERVAESFNIDNKRNIDFQIDKNSLNQTIVIDEVLMTNVFVNIIDNAIKYSQDNQNTIIVISATSRSKQLDISIKDNGIGIDKKDIKKIFDKFYRVENEYVHNVKGFGLGLNYVKWIIEAHKGKIAVYSKLREGSQFVISLPVES